MYNYLTPELVKARQNTVFLTNKYNASFGQPSEIRESLLKYIGTEVHLVKLLNVLHKTIRLDLIQNKKLIN